WSGIPARTGCVSCSRSAGNSATQAALSHRQQLEARTMMHPSMEIAFFGSSLVSAYWNGAATYYRGIISALHARGHHVTFYEPDAFDRQAHRDINDPEWATVVVYENEPRAVHAALAAAEDADVIVKASGVGVFDEPATLERVQPSERDPFRPLIGRYDLVFTYGGGQPVIDAYRALGARCCAPIYNALDPSTHHPVPPDSRFGGLLGFLGNRLPDRESRVREFFFRPAAAQPEGTFLLGGNGWDPQAGAPPNVRLLGHIYSRDHNAFNCSPRAVIK